ncbi:Ig-like domain-containing protein [Paenibacillus sp. FSL M7-0802]|uniref:Ig-like domain-containing protein n=1 Tax=Paenibacillus sp. FSL M7-0802 TaxID=2921536 RepID=UPI0030F6B541
MSESWYLMNQTYYSGFEREQFDNYAASGFSELLNVSPEAYTVTINGLEEKVIIQQTTKDNILKILGNIESFAAGDIVTYKGHDYLINLLPQDNRMYQVSKMEMCNINLKWLDETGNIISYPSVVYFNTRSSFGIEEGKIMNLVDGRRQTVLPKNKDTVKIRRDQRFIIGGDLFKVNDVDFVSDEGLVNLSFKSDTYNSTTDNLELGIADYNGKVADYKVNILNRDVTAFKVGETLQLNVKVTNRDVPMEAVVTYSSSDESIATIDENGMITAIAKGSCIVTAEYKNVSDSIQLNVIEDVVNNYSAEITGDDYIKYNMIKTFTAIFRNNGTQQVDKSRFWITGLDGEATTLATITEQNETENTCKVKAGNKKGYVLLHTENSSGLSRTSKKIEIKSLL